MKYIVFTFMMFVMIWQIQHQPRGPEDLNRKIAPAKAGIEKEVPAPRRQASVRLVQRYSRFLVNVFSCRDIVIDPESLKPLNRDGEYRWFVNNRRIEEAVDNVLAKDHFRAGDQVCCRLKTMNENGRPVEVEFHYTVLNSPPLLNLPPIGHYRIPGNFHYRIFARDPDPLPDSDGRLYYELISPVEADIDLDGETGEIDWFIDQETLGKYPEGVRIRFKVSDAAGAAAQSSINLNFHLNES